ncbi:MAG: hypothetical protein LDL56_12830, partial [Armatimonadetes bacterium]|nr:hypothetical protein [Armatimonadota bacterium]
PDSIVTALNLAQGPVFRFALALAVLGLLRRVVLVGSDLAAALVAERDRAVLWHKLRLRLLWVVFPTLILHRGGTLPSAGQLLYHSFFSCVSLVFRLGMILVPIFMVAHVHLWERALGISWPTFPGTLADTLSYLTIATGFLLFLGRVYSAPLRRLDPPWAFFKPLIMLVPFVTGVLAMHPRWCPVDYHVMLLAHVLSACVVIALLPFARLFSLHVRLTRILPEAAWQPEPSVPPPTGPRAARPVVPE